MEIIIDKFKDPNIEIKTFRELYKFVHFGMRVNAVYPDQISYKYIIWRCINISVQISGVYVLAHATIKDIEMKDYSDATRQLSIMTLIIIMIGKFMNCLINRETIKSLISRMDKAYADAKTNKSQEEMEIVRKSIQYAVVIQNIWAVQVIFVGSVFSFTAFGIMLYLIFSDAQFERKMIFYTIFPYGDHLKFISPYYEMSLVYEIFINFFVTILYVAYDPLIPIFALFVCGQFDVIKSTIQNIIKTDEISSEKMIADKFVKVIEDLQALYSFAEDINKSTSMVSQFVFSVSPILSTVSGFQIYSMLKNGEIPYEFLFFFGATLFHIYMPSYFGNLLEEKSLSVADSLYQCGWEDCPYIPIRKTVLLMTVRSQRTVVLCTVFSTISLMLFSQVCQTTWGMFNLLVVAFDGE